MTKQDVDDFAQRLFADGRRARFAYGRKSVGVAKAMGNPGDQAMSDNDIPGSDRTGHDGAAQDGAAHHRPAREGRKA